MSPKASLSLVILAAAGWASRPPEAIIISNQKRK
jgi:hypothetical protein